jgi:hypothetical protein
MDGIGLPWMFEPDRSAARSRSGITSDSTSASVIRTAVNGTGTVEELGSV